MPVMCNVCNAIELHSESRKEYGICSDCVETLGIAPMPPTRRPPVPCMRCNAQRFVRSVPRVKGVQYDRGSRMPGTSFSVNKLTYPIELETHLIGISATVRKPATADGLGTVEAYICVKCGYVEWYCWDPDEILIGPEHMTEVVDYSTDKPYR